MTEATDCLGGGAPMAAMANRCSGSCSDGGAAEAAAVLTAVTAWQGWRQCCNWEAAGEERMRRA